MITASAASPVISLLLPNATPTVAAVKAGATVVIDVVVQTGYSAAMTAGLTRSAD